MSLPSRANFYDKNGVFIDSCFVNCGWFFNLNSLVRVVSRDVVPSDAYKNPETFSVKLYGVTIPKQLIEDCGGHTFEVVEELFGCFLSDQL